MTSQEFHEAARAEVSTTWRSLQMLRKMAKDPEIGN